MWFPTVAGGRSKPYQARYRAPDGREPTRPFRRKLDAERWLIEKERDKARGGLGRARADGVFTEMARKGRGDPPQSPALVTRSRSKPAFEGLDEAAADSLDKAIARSAVGLPPGRATQRGNTARRNTRNPLP